MLVFAAFLFIVGVTASGQAALVTADSTNSLLNASVGADVGAVRSFIGLNLRQEDLQPGGLSADRQATLQHGLQLLVDGSGILRAALLAPDGTSSTACSCWSTAAESCGPHCSLRTAPCW